ncbi:translesion DNA synthesis-associated protein ImuA [Marinobacter sp. C2H3]|uniref:translesion DNA synthesis-associated protein ImuA n=1 Tax=Marinobacter sp. C2H3 TaxID=3119003 RepID=UPI00300E8E52
MSELLNTLIQDARVWQGRPQHQSALPAEPTGYQALDNQLGGLGWPRGALSECLLDAPGIGELQLVLPLMRRLGDAGKTVFWINPPHTPYAPALARDGVNLDALVIVHTRPADTLWTLENCLRSPVTGLVLAWPGTLATRDLRRLQLAAEAGSNVCVLFRERRLAEQNSPAALRLELAADHRHRLNVHVLKRRGSWPGQRCALDLGHRANLAPATPPTQPQAARENAPVRTPVLQGPWPGP